MQIYILSCKHSLYQHIFIFQNLNLKTKPKDVVCPWVMLKLRNLVIRNIDQIRCFDKLSMT